MEIRFFNPKKDICDECGTGGLSSLTEHKSCISEDIIQNYLCSNCIGKYDKIEKVIIVADEVE